MFLLFNLKVAANTISKNKNYLLNIKKYQSQNLKAMAFLVDLRYNKITGK